MMQQMISKSKVKEETDKSLISHQMLNKTCSNMRNYFYDVSIYLQIQACLNEVIYEVEYNDQLESLRKLKENAKNSEKENTRRDKEMEETKKFIDNDTEITMKDIDYHKKEQQNHLLKKIALIQSVQDCDKQLHLLTEQKKKFSQMKDISQLNNEIVTMILRYVEVKDFVCAICSCRAWYYALNQSRYWCCIRRNFMKANFWKPKEPAKPKPKRVTFAVVALTLPSTARNKQPSVDDIFQQCIQQLQKVIAQEEANKEELEERLVAEQGITKFMQASMQDKMHELSELKVRRWQMKQNLNVHGETKKEKSMKIKELEEALNVERKKIEQLKKQYDETEDNRSRQYKLKCDLSQVSMGSNNMTLENEINALRTKSKRIAKVCMQMRDEAAKREQEIKKYTERINLLKLQYQQYNQKQNNVGHLP